MSYEVMYAVVSTYDYSVVMWETLCEIGKERIKKWAENNPMPPSKTFRDFDEFLDRVEQAEGALVFNKQENDDFIGWVVDAIDELY